MTMSYSHIFQIVLEKDSCAVDNGGCAHQCFSKYGSYDCLCNLGYELKSDMRDCEGKRSLHAVFFVSMFCVLRHSFK